MKLTDTHFSTKYADQLTALGVKRGQLQEREGYFQVKLGLVTLSVDHDIWGGAGREKRTVQINWSAIGAVEPREASRFVTHLNGMIALAALIRTDLSKARLLAIPRRRRRA